MVKSTPLKSLFSGLAIIYKSRPTLTHWCPFGKVGVSVPEIMRLFKLAPVKLISAKSSSVKIAFVKSAPFKSAFVKLAFLKSA